jgi:tetratricopeptide (TPR) repeat protein
MCRTAIALLISFTFLGLLRAGLYESGEKYEFVPKDGKVAAHSFDSFRLRLSDLRGIGVPPPQPPSKLRKEYMAKRDQLNAARRRLSAPELDVLGACYYRLFEFDSALAAWSDATRKDPRNFAAYSNLVLLHLATGDVRGARTGEGDARSQRPTDIPGMTKEQSAWYFRVDDHLRQLIRGRLDEHGKGIPVDQLLPDDLFRVQFVADDGTYQPGTIAAAQKEKLPADAIAVVQQLLFWLPHDPRLLWLLAELYNAEGDPASALTLLNECVDPYRFHPAALNEHRIILERHFEELRTQDEARQREEEQQRLEGERHKRRSFWWMVVAGAIAGAGLVGWQLYIMARRVGRKKT